MNARWLRIGGTLMLGMFVSYIDRTNLSVSLTSVALDLGFAGDRFATVSGWVLTAFLIGYIFANIFGGVFTSRIDPKKIAVLMMGLWSVSTLVTGMVQSVMLLVICRLVLGIAEGIYWPQQSRFVKLWFSPNELTRANSVIQYYGQFLALGLGFIILTPIHAALGWRNLFYLCGAIGLFVMVPLYAKTLLSTADAPYPEKPKNAAAEKPPKLTLASFGGLSFALVVFAYLTQGMLFWGITLWIPMAVKSMGFSGMGQAFGSSMPYLAAVALAVPMAYISDKTGKRVLIAALGLLIPGILLLLLPTVDNGYLKLALITFAMGYFASSFTPNIWSIIQSNVQPYAIGAASGIVNGVGAGGGGTLAGLMVARIYAKTGSYMSGFMILGGLVVLGGLSLLLYGLIRRHSPLAIQTIKAS